MKTERTQIHFLSDVLVAVTSLDLKVANMLSEKRHYINTLVNNQTTIKRNCPTFNFPFSVFISKPPIFGYSKNDQ